MSVNRCRVLTWPDRRCSATEATERNRLTTSQDLSLGSDGDAFADNAGSGSISSYQVSAGSAGVAAS